MHPVVPPWRAVHFVTWHLLFFTVTTGLVVIELTMWWEHSHHSAMSPAKASLSPGASLATTLLALFALM